MSSRNTMPKLYMCSQIRQKAKVLKMFWPVLACLPKRETPLENEFHMCWGLGWWVAWWKSFRSVIFSLRENRPGTNKHDTAWWQNGIPSWLRDLLSQLRRVHVQSQGEVTRPFWDPISSTGRVVLVPSWSIFSPTKENWPERLPPHHSPAKALT